MIVMKNESGFGVLGILFLIILLVLGFVGWRVVQTGSSSPSLDSVTFVHPENSFVAVGDIVCGPAGKVFNDPEHCQSDKTVETAKKLKPDFILGLGDLQYEDGALSSFRNLYDKSWGQLKSVTYPSPGNHEYVTDNAAGYFDYFKVNNSALANVIGQPYFSFNKNGWHFISLNSNCDKIGGCGEGSPQIAWLQKDLAASTTKCTVAFWHHPRFTSGKYASSQANKDLSKTFWEELYQSKVDIILNGHDHLYERFAPQAADGTTDASGSQEFIVGTGGKELYKQTTTAPNSKKIIDNQFGVLQLEMFGKAYKWSFVDVEGKTLDSGYRACV
jgi:hypothetical protein